MADGQQVAAGRQRIVRRSLMGGRVATMPWLPTAAIRNAVPRAAPSSMLIRALTRTLEWEPPGHTDQTTDVLT